MTGRRTCVSSIRSDSPMVPAWASCGRAFSRVRTPAAGRRRGCPGRRRRRHRGARRSGSRPGTRPRGGRRIWPMNNWRSLLPALHRIGRGASKLPPIYWLVFLGIGAVIWSGGAPDERGVRLHARFALTCPADWTSRATQFWDGRIGVNTVFRPSPTNSTRDRNILEMYFSGRTGRRTPPPVPIETGYVWVVDAHDTDDSYRYEERGVRTCWQISGVN